MVSEPSVPVPWAIKVPGSRPSSTGGGGSMATETPAARRRIAASLARRVNSSRSAELKERSRHRPLPSISRVRMKWPSPGASLFAVTLMATPPAIEAPEMASTIISVPVSAMSVKTSIAAGRPSEILAMAMSLTAQVWEGCDDMRFEIEQRLDLDCGDRHEVGRRAQEIAGAGIERTFPTATRSGPRSFARRRASPREAPAPRRAKRRCR